MPCSIALLHKVAAVASSAVRHRVVPLLAPTESAAARLAFVPSTVSAESALLTQ